MLLLKDPVQLQEMDPQRSSFAARSSLSLVTAWYCGVERSAAKLWLQLFPQLAQGWHQEPFFVLGEECGAQLYPLHLVLFFVGPLGLGAVSSSSSTTLGVNFLLLGPSSTIPALI